MSLIKKLNLIVFLSSLISLIFFLIRPIPLPLQDEILISLKNIQPFMQKLDEKEYQKNFGSTSYKIKPYYSYEIYGLVVEKYDSDNWLDITHEKDPAQTKDLCLIWGENIKTDAYRNGKYKHGEFTCFYQLDKDFKGQFFGNQLSNNHLVPENEELKKLIKEVNVGDQVFIKGKLIDYTILDENGKDLMYRNTNTNLNDPNCEVILVNDFKILKRPPSYLREAKIISAKVLGISTLLGFILIFI